VQRSFDSFAGSPVVELVVVVAIMYGHLSFHLTCTCQSSVVCKFETNFRSQTRNTFRNEGILSVRRLFNQRSLLYQCKHIRRCELVAALQNDKSRKDDDSASFYWTKTSIPDSIKFDNKYANVCLEDVPNLSVEC